ncbi:MAG: hypothetical protein WKF43_07890 [Acidimicrobiales bacterium]
MALVTEGLADVIEIARQDRPLYDSLPIVLSRWWPGSCDWRSAGGRNGHPRWRRWTSPPSPRSGGGGHRPPASSTPTSTLPTSGVWPASSPSGATRPCSHEVSPEFRGVRGTVTTVVDAYLRSATRSYLRGLDEVAEWVLVMTSAGGLVAL